MKKEFIDGNGTVPVMSAMDRQSVIRDEHACSDKALDDYGDYIAGDPFHRGFTKVDDIADLAADPEAILIAMEEAHFSGRIYLGLTADQISRRRYEEEERFLAAASEILADIDQAIKDAKGHSPASNIDYRQKFDERWNRCDVLWITTNDLLTAKNDGKIYVGPAVAATSEETVAETVQVLEKRLNLEDKGSRKKSTYLLRRRIAIQPTA